MLVLTVLVGGACYVASLARLFMPEVASPDDVMPALVKMLLPDIGLQLFVLAIVSASLSTATAIFHIAVAAIAEDLPGRKTSRGMWFAGIVFCVLLSGGCAQIKGQIIAMLCTTSWSIVNTTVLASGLSGPGALRQAQQPGRLVQLRCGLRELHALVPHDAPAVRHPAHALAFAGRAAALLRGLCLLAGRLGTRLGPGWRRPPELLVLARGHEAGCNS